MSTPANILILTYWSYKDALIQTYTLPYVYQIAEQIKPKGKIYLFTLEKDGLSLSDSESKEVEEKLLKHGIHWIPKKYYPWGINAAVSWIFVLIKLYFFVWFKRISHIHAWCTPAGAAGYLLSVTTGRKLIIDSFEPHADAMVENGSWRKESMAFKILFFLEKLQTKRAKYLIAANRNMGNYTLERYGKFSAKMFEKPACVDLELFNTDNKKNPELIEKLGLKDKIVCVYAGKFGGIYLDREVFDFFKTAHNYWGDKFRVLLLTNQSDEELKAFCQKSNLDFSIIIKKFVPHREVATFLSLGDFAITPVKSVYTKQFCTPIKDGEYWALGLPVVITKNISVDSEIIDRENIGYVLKDLTTEEYEKAVQAIDRLIKEADLAQKIREVAIRERNFSISDKIYKEIYSPISKSLE